MGGRVLLVMFNLKGDEMLAVEASLLLEPFPEPKPLVQECCCSAHAGEFQLTAGSSIRFGHF